ncbi:hypothetical protein IPH25_02660 [bacterium]|nr:MAG: hypothetical protein IPG37_04800 [bacterium]QQR62320.1 MAG: hypothetical protein IPH25_02660 [bacterium]
MTFISISNLFYAMQPNHLEDQFKMITRACFQDYGSEYNHQDGAYYVKPPEGINFFTQGFITVGEPNKNSVFVPFVYLGLKDGNSWFRIADFNRIQGVKYTLKATVDEEFCDRLNNQSRNIQDSQQRRALNKRFFFHTIQNICMACQFDDRHRAHLKSALLNFNIDLSEPDLKVATTFLVQHEYYSILYFLNVVPRVHFSRLVDPESDGNIAHYAVTPKMLVFLKNKLGVNINHASKTGQYPIMNVLQYCTKNNLRSLKNMHAVDLLVRDNEGNSLLHKLSDMKGRFFFEQDELKGMVEELMQSGCLILQKNRSGLTPVAYAALKHEHLIEDILQNYQDKVIQLSVVLLAAIRQFKLEK